MKECFETRLRVRRVQRRINCACFKNGEDGEREFTGALKINGDWFFGSGSEFLEMSRKLIRFLVELLMAE